METPSPDGARRRASSEYDVVLAPPASAAARRDLDQAQGLFAEASRRYLESPWPWLAWSLILPAASLLTPAVGSAFAEPGVVLLWSGAIFAGGAIEGVAQHGRRAPSSGLARWAFRAQANLSLTAVALSAAVFTAGKVSLLPAIWLLCLGHSLYTLGGLAFAPMRQAGLIYQLGGALALLPGLQPLALFAGATFLGNLRMAVGVARRGPTEAPR